MLALICAISSANASHNISNGVLTTHFGPRGIESVVLAGWDPIKVTHDDFAVRLTTGSITGAALPDPVVTVSNRTNFGLRFASALVVVDVMYAVQAGAAFVCKTLALTQDPPANTTVHEVAPFSGTLLTVGGRAPSQSVTVSSVHKLKDYVLFQRWPGLGVFLAAHNPYLNASADNATGAATVSYAPEMPMLGGVFGADSALLGVQALSGSMLAAPAPPIDEAEQRAVVAAVRAAMVVPQPAGVTTKINIAWTENDYQIDIATADGRQE